MTTPFKVVTQKVMGTLKPAAKKKHEELLARRAELLEIMESLEAEVQEQLAQTVDKLQIDDEWPFTGLHITDDGEVIALYDQTPEGQAALNHVTVAVATENMIEQGLIKGVTADQERQRALFIDRQKGVPMVH